MSEFDSYEEELVADFHKHNDTQDIDVNVDDPKRLARNCQVKKQEDRSKFLEIARNTDPTLDPKLTELIVDFIMTKPYSLTPRAFQSQFAALHAFAEEYKSQS